MAIELSCLCLNELAFNFLHYKIQLSELLPFDNYKKIQNKKLKYILMY